MPKYKMLDYVMLFEMANLMGQEDIRRGVMLTLGSDLAAGYFQLVLSVS